MLDTCTLHIPTTQNTCVLKNKSFVYEGVHTKIKKPWDDINRKTHFPYGFVKINFVTITRILNFFGFSRILIGYES